MKIHSVFSFCQKKLAVFLILTLLCVSSNTALADEYGVNNPNTVGLTFYTNFQLIDTLPNVDPGLGGGFYWDYRFNDRFSFQIEAFAITHDGNDVSDNEDNIELFGFPVSTFKLYVLEKKYRFDPYVGTGVGLYWLTEGEANNDTGGLGLGAQIETACDFNIEENLVATLGGAYRSVGLINSLEGTSKASTFMVYTFFARIGYRF